jgi:hypothetical protein
VLAGSRHDAHYIRYRAAESNPAAPPIGLGQLISEQARQMRVKDAFGRLGIAGRERVDDPRVLFDRRLDSPGISP